MQTSESKVQILTKYSKLAAPGFTRAVMNNSEGTMIKSVNVMLGCVHGISYLSFKFYRIRFSFTNINGNKHTNAQIFAVIILKVGSSVICPQLDVSLSA